MEVAAGAFGAAIVALIVMYFVFERRLPFQTKSTVDKSTDAVAEGIASLVVEQFGRRLSELSDIEALTAEKLHLDSELVTLRREKDEIELAFKQRERTIEHAAGLLRKELEAELKQGLAAASHDAEKRVLEVERDFGKKQMAFAEQRFKGELETLNGLVQTLTDRLPDVSARMNLKGKA